MTDKIKKRPLILWVAIIVSLITYLGWQPIKTQTGIQIFYIGMAVFIFLLSLYIWKLSDKHSMPEFILFALSLNNLIDELFYDPTKFGSNEIVFLVVVIVYSLKLKNKKIFNIWAKKE